MGAPVLGSLLLMYEAQVEFQGPGSGLLQPGFLVVVDKVVVLDYAYD